MQFLRATFAAAALVLAAAGWPAAAQDSAAGWIADGEPGSFNHEFTRRLYHESLLSARDWADENRGSGDQTPEFAYGVALFFGAVEGLIADFSRYGMNRDDTFGVPFLRLFAPANPDPETVDYAAFRAIMARFDTRLDQARAVLEGVDDPAAALSFRPAGARLDLNGDGVYASNERLMPVFAQVVDPWSQPDERFWADAGAEIDAFVASLAAGDAEALGQLDILAPPFAFDRADAAWLAGYAHLLSAFADFILAHEFEEQFNYGMLPFFPGADTPYEGLKAAHRSEMLSRFFLEDLSTMAMITDFVAFFLGEKFDLAEPQRLAGLRADLLGMIAQSRRSWGFVDAETDNLAARPPAGFPEWIPGPHQAGLPGFPQVTERVRTAWTDFLDVFEAVLQGELLLPHWRFEQGINLQAMLDNPQPYSPALILQGTSVLPYLEEGEIASPETLEPVDMILGADFFTYAIWFN